MNLDATAPAIRLTRQWSITEAADWIDVHARRLDCNEPKVIKTLLALVEAGVLRDEASPATD